MNGKDLLVSLLFALGAYLIYRSRKAKKRKTLQKYGALNAHHKNKNRKGWTCTIGCALLALLYLILSFTE